MDPPEFQGDDVHIRFEIDEEMRLRRLVVTYKIDDRSQTITATLSDLGEPVEIEPLTDGEILTE